MEGELVSGGDLKEGEPAGIHESATVSVDVAIIRSYQDGLALPEGADPG